MLNIDLTKKVLRARAHASVVSLRESAVVHEMVLSLIATNPVTHQVYWEPPFPILDGSGVFPVTVSPEGATIERLDESGLHVLLPYHGEQIAAHLPYDYLCQIECSDLEGNIVYFDMLPVFLEPEEVSVQQPRPAENKRSHLRLVR